MAYLKRLLNDVGCWNCRQILLMSHWCHFLQMWRPCHHEPLQGGTTDWHQHMSTWVHVENTWWGSQAFGSVSSQVGLLGISSNNRSLWTAVFTLWKHSVQEESCTLSKECQQAHVSEQLAAPSLDIRRSNNALHLINCTLHVHVIHSTILNI